MAHEQPSPQAKAPWKKIFTAFKIALDMKKLLLAAAGILAMCLGWQVLGWTFHGMRKIPTWEDKAGIPEAEKKVSWNEFKARRDAWNLLHELAGSPSEKIKVDAADVASDLGEYELLANWEQAHSRLAEPIVIKDKTLEIKSNSNFKFTLKDDPNLPALSKNRDLKLGALKIVENTEADKIIEIDGVKLKVESGPFDDLKKYRNEALDRAQIAALAATSDNPKAKKALAFFDEYLARPAAKPSGKLRGWPWSEYRGRNPYLLVTGFIRTGEDAAGTPFPSLSWLWSEQAPVLLEPLFKFLLPVKYLFDPRAGFWDRLYLIMIMLWTLAVWGFCGGAIRRIAAVQVARNERITLREAIDFTRERYVSYLVAPIFPLVLVGMLTVGLMVYGWVLVWTPWWGDFFGALLWPIVLVIGFIMAVVLVGLVGWPLMNATVSTEGSDSFDALSRSYSYVYQAPWRYLWYSVLAIVYGAALVFFIGFMASMMVYVGKWGVGSAWGLGKADPASDREPSFLFDYAPTSFGWRDLLISTNQHVEVVQERTSSGHVITHLDFKPDYKATVTSANRLGAFLVAIWLYLFFLLVVAFGYSYFWTASTIIYFLMRHDVDDTDMDDVHLEDEGMEDPFQKPMTPAVTPAAPTKPGTLSLNVIEAPPPAATPKPPTVAPPPPPFAPTPAPPPPSASPLPTVPLASDIPPPLAITATPEPPSPLPGLPPTSDGQPHKVDGPAEHRAEDKPSQP